MIEKDWLLYLTKKEPFEYALKDMRLSQQQRQAILDAIRGRDPEARIILFGSRASDLERGGDIDLLVISDLLGFRDELGIRREILDRIGWQKLHLLIRRRDQLASGIAQMAFQSGIDLDSPTDSE